MVLPIGLPVSFCHGTHYLVIVWFSLQSVHREEEVRVVV